MTDSLEKLKRQALPVLKQHGVVRAAIFGSRARGSEKDLSDIDMVVEFGGDQSLLHLVAVQLELREVLGTKVDVLTYRGMNPRIKERILREQVRIL